MVSVLTEAQFSSTIAGFENFILKVLVFKIISNEKGFILYAYLLCFIVKRNLAWLGLIQLCMVFNSYIWFLCE